jgi:hypothetical protein
MPITRSNRDHVEQTFLGEPGIINSLRVPQPGVDGQTTDKRQHRAQPGVDEGMVKVDLHLTEDPFLPSVLRGEI